MRAEAVGTSRAKTPPGGTQYIYVTGWLSDTVAVAKVRPGMAPQIVGQSSPTSFGTYDLVTSPDGRFLYVALTSENGIAAFSIGAGGKLTEVAGSPVSAPGPVWSLVVAPDGKHLYATGSGEPDGTVISYSVTPKGLPVQDAAVPVPLEATSHLTMMTVDPTGRNVYVTDGIGSLIFQLPIAANGTALAPIQRYVRGALGPAITPDGHYLLAPNEIDGLVASFRIFADGSLARAPGSPYPAGQSPHMIAVTPDGSRAYVPNVGSNDISGYAIGRNGRLTPLPGSPYPAGESPGRAFVSRDGKRLYVVGIGSMNGFTTQLRTYDLLANGALRESERPLDIPVRFADGPTSDITR